MADTMEDATEETSMADTVKDAVEDAPEADAGLDDATDISADSMGDSGAMGDSEPAGAEDAAAPDAMSDAAASGACMNDSDLAQHSSQDIPEFVIATAKACYISGKFEDGDYTDCIMELINDPDGINLTPECTDCYTASAVCAKAFCDIECLGPNDEACEACREDNGCTPNFYECSGLTQTE